MIQMMADIVNQRPANIFLQPTPSQYTMDVGRAAGKLAVKERSGMNQSPCSKRSSSAVS